MDNSRNKNVDASSTTRRTLHYYWLVTKRHKGYFFGLMISTFAFVALLTYGNPYVMSLIVDRVGADPVSSEQVFEVLMFLVRRQVSYKTIRCIN